MCFSLDWFGHFVVTLIIVGAVLLLLQLLISFVAPKIGVAGEVLAFVTQAFKIILWAVVLIALVWFILGLIGCLVGSGGIGLRLH